MCKASVRNRKTKAAKAAKSQSRDIRNLSDESKIVEQYARLVVWVLNRMKLKPTADFDEDDAYNAGVFGIVKAARSFRPGRSKFITYATHCIYREIRDARRVAVRGARQCDAPEPQLRAINSTEPSPERAVDARLDAEAFLATLSPDDAAFIRRIYWDGMAVHEALHQFSRDRARRLHAKLTHIKPAQSDTGITFLPK